jgi:glycine/D-amino acid oxidase-like deaminating enzyme
MQVRHVNLIAVDPARLMAALLSTARASGAQVRPRSAAVGMSMTGERIDGVRTSDGQTVRTDAVVNCAGPGAGEVAALAGVDLPMRGGGRLLLHYPSSELCCRNSVWTCWSWW